MLDRLVKPHWPNLPEKFQHFQLGKMSDRIARACSSIPDDPLNYDFLYHILDADDQGRQSKMDDQTVNKAFNTKSVSCLRRIAESEDKVGSKGYVLDLCIRKNVESVGLNVGTSKILEYLKKILTHLLSGFVVRPRLTMNDFYMTDNSILSPQTIEERKRVEKF